MILDREVETRPGGAARLDEAAFREQLEYLLERSPFYRERLGGLRPDGLDEIAQLPLTDKAELHATVTDETRSARTSAPSGRDRPHLLDERHDRSAELHPADRRRPRQLGHRLGAELRRLRRRARQRIVSTYNAGPFVAGAALDAFERIGLAHVPVGDREHRAARAGDRALRPEAVVLTPSYAAYLLEWAADRGIDLRASQRRARARRRRAGRRRAGLPRLLEEGWGARVTEAMGIGDIGVSLWGECEAQDGMHLGARGFVHAELIDPETGAAHDAGGRRRGRARADPPAPPRGAAAALPHARPRRSSARAACTCGRTGPRIRCIGRTDDMLIVRGVNVFPSAVREVVGGFAPQVERQRARPPAGARREAGAAAPGPRRARARRPGRPRARRRDP